MTTKVDALVGRTNQQAAHAAKKATSAAVALGVVTATLLIKKLIARQMDVGAAIIPWGDRSSS